MRTAAENRKARHHYRIDSTVEAGVVLTGTEVKSLRGGMASLEQAHAAVRAGEVFLLNAHIPEYEAGNRFNHAPGRPRKLLMRRREIDRLAAAVKRAGVTLVPLKIYFNDKGRVKVSLGLAKGRKMHDRRQAGKERDWQRDKARLMRNRG